jgi:outer membrane protein assembly factor BamB
MPDGKRFLESYYDASQMRDVQTGAVVWVMDRREPMGRLLVSPDGSRIASLGAQGTRLHDGASGKVIWHQPGAEPLAFSADGKTLYARTRDWHLLALDTIDGTVRSQIDRQRTETTAFYPSSDGKRALAADYNHLTAYDLKSGRQIWHLEKADSVYSYAVLPDSSAFVSYGQAIHLRSMATGLDLGPPLSLDEMPGAPDRLIVSDDGKTLLLGSSEGLVYRFALDPSAR